jgi:sec-independent protein translocase protein TatA
MMGGFSLWHWVIVLLIVVILFGRGRISDIMGDFGKGITSFKKGMSEAEKSVDPTPAEPAQRIEGPAPVAADPAAAKPVDQSTSA